MTFRTARDVERLTLPEGKAEVFHFDARGTGLSVRIQRGGKPSFVVWFTAGGKRKRLTLAPVASLSLEDARRKAGEITAAARAGRDPAQERRQAKAPQAGLTVEGLIEAYLREAEKRQRPRSLTETKRHLERNVKALHHLPAPSVGRREVSALLLGLSASNGPVAANRTRSTLSAAFAWGMRAGLVDANPTIATVRAEERSRERVLTIGELGAIWQATASLGTYDRIVRLLILTGARRSEVAAMRECELDRERGLWVLPPERTKNGRPHEVSLPTQAQALLPPVQGDNAYLFVGRGGGAFANWSDNKKRLNVSLEALIVTPWCLHDIRRTVVTYMAKIGVQTNIIEAVVNHVSGHKAGVAGIYNRAHYRIEKKEALQSWADWLERNL